MNTSRVMFATCTSLAAILVIGVFVGRGTMGPVNGAEYNAADSGRSLPMPPELEPPGEDDEQSLVSLAGPGPSVVGQVSRSCYDLEPDGGLLYAVCGHELVVFDITSPTAPVEVASIAGADEAHALAVSGSYAYVADAVGRLLVYDVTSPASMTVVSDSLIPMGVPRDMAISGNTLFIAEGDGGTNVPSGLRLIDITNPANPSQASLDVLADVEARSLFVNGSTVFVGTWSIEGHGGLYVYDASVPTALDAISSVVTDGGVTGVALDSNHVYLSVNSFAESHEKAELRIVDVADDSEPSSVGSYPFPKASTALNVPGFSTRRDVPSLYGIANLGPIVFSLESHYGLGPTDADARRHFLLRSIDASVPTSPVDSGSVALDIENPAAVVAHGGYVYVAGGESGIFIIQP